MFGATSFNDNAAVRDNIFSETLADNEVFSKFSTEETTEILKITNGIGFNQNGDIVGKDGKVSLKASELREQFRSFYNTGTEVNPLDYADVTIDGVKYIINDKGEAVDNTGKIVKSMAEVKALLTEGGVINDNIEPTDIAGILAAANKALGYEFLDEQGNPISFEPTIEGMAARDKYLIENISARIAQESVQQIFQADTDFESLYLYKKQFGTSVGWTPAPDYSKTILLPATDAKAEAQHEELIIKAEMARGRSADEAKMFAKYLIDDGKGEAHATKALEFLKGYDVERLNQLRDKQAADEKAQQDSIIAHWNKVNEIINTGKANGITIPAYIPVKDENGVVRHVPRQALYEFMSKPVENGRSALQVYNSKMTPEDQIVDALMKFTRYSYGDVVKATANASKVEFTRRVANGNAGSNRKTVGGKSPVDSVIL